MTASTSPLAAQLAAKTGLAPIIANGVIRRACARLGLSPEQLSQRDLPKLIEVMVPLIQVYLPASEAATRVADLRRFGNV